MTGGRSAMLVKGVTLVAMGGLAVMAWLAFPEVKRYVEMRRM